MNVDRLVVASQNPDKIREVEQVLANLERPPQIVRGLTWPEIEETESTLAGNALLKARAVAELTGLPALADDTGLEVDALDGAPGVHTARYAGPNATYEANVDKLLLAMSGIGDRTARFRTAIALVDPLGDEVVVHGVLDGRIATSRRGTGGFGYDPVFELADGRTLAEIPESEKNTISHRARGLHALVAALEGPAPTREPGVVYRHASGADAGAVRQLLAANGWEHRVSDLDRVEALIGQATRCLTAWDGFRLVGFGRAITDDVSNGYLSMVVVDEAYRRRGVGSNLVRKLMGDDPSITWVLRAGGGREFWMALGFEESTIAMERTRTPEAPTR